MRASLPSPPGTSSTAPTDPTHAQAQAQAPRWQTRATPARDCTILRARRSASTKRRSSSSRRRGRLSRCGEASRRVTTTSTIATVQPISSCCLRPTSGTTPTHEFAAWRARRNTHKANWHFTFADARAKITETLSRPLFEPARRAHAGVTAPPPPMPPRQPSTLMYRLLGVVLGPDHAVALLAKENARPVRAEVGDSIDGWEVVRITREEVRLARQGRQQVLTLTRR